MQSAVVIEIASFLAGPFYDFNFSVQIQFVSTVSHPFRLVNFHFNIASFLVRPVLYDFSVQIQFVSTVSLPFGLMNFRFNIVLRK